MGNSGLDDVVDNLVKEIGSVQDAKIKFVEVYGASSDKRREVVQSLRQRGEWVVWGSEEKTKKTEGYVPHYHIDLDYILEHYFPDSRSDLNLSTLSPVNLSIS